MPNLFCPKIYFSASHPFEIYQSSVNITYPFTSFPACSGQLHNTFLLLQNHPDLTCHITNASSLTHTHINLFDKQWPWYEPNRKNRPDTKQVNLWVWKNDISSKLSERPGSGRRRLASRSQECSGWLQGVGKLQGGYQSLLIRTWTWFSCDFHVRERRVEQTSCTSSEIGILSHHQWFPEHCMLSSSLWLDIDLGLISMSFCNVRISSARAEFFKSRRDLTLLKMSPTPIEEQQFCPVNKSLQKSIKNILNRISGVSF